MIWKKLPCVFCRDHCREFGNASLCSCSDKLHQEGTLSPVQCQSVISCNPKKGCSETPNVTNIHDAVTCNIQPCHSPLIARKNLEKCATESHCICQETVHIHYTYGTFLENWEKRDACSSMYQHCIGTYIGIFTRPAASNSEGNISSARAPTAEILRKTFS